MRAEDGPVADRAPIYRVKRLSNVVACGGHHLAGVGAARRHGRKRRIRHAQLVCLGLYRAGQLVDLPARGPLAVAANRRLPGGAWHGEGASTRLRVRGAKALQEL
eukprot:366480-Chlamydomonas_euryale.AAC.5